MEEIKINDSVLLKVKRIEVVGKVTKIENDMATCSFYMPRSKGMSMIKIPLHEITKVKSTTTFSEKPENK